MHNENVEDEEEPRDTHDGVLVVIETCLFRIIATVLFLNHLPFDYPFSILRLCKITDRVPKSLQNVDDQWERAKEFVVLIIVFSLENVRDQYKNCTECEKDYQEWINVLRHLHKHFDEEAEGFVVSNELQKLCCTLHQTNDGYNFEPKPLGSVLFLMILMTFHVNLDCIHNSLRAIHVVPLIF